MVSNIILQLSQENVITGQDTTGFIVNKTALSTYVQTHDVLAILFDVNNGLTTTTYLRAVVNKWTFHDKVMGEQYISFTISAETPITWAIGDYCIFRGEVFTLNYLPSIAQKAGTGKSLESYNYDQVKMESRQEELTRCQLRDIVLTSGQHSASEGTNYTGSASFELFCGETTMVIGGQVVTRTAVCTLADRIQANLNAFYGDNVWTVLVDTTSTYIDATGQEVLVTHTENKKLTFDNNTVAEALAEVHNTFGLDYCVHGRTIYIGYDMGDVTANSSDEQFAFGYGQGYPTPSDEHKALFEIRKISDSSQKIVTRLRVLGSTKNLKYQYYFKKYNLPQALITTNLQLPDTFLPEGTRVNPDPSTKWANNAARLAAGLRAVQGAENDAYIEKNDDAPHCAEGIREATVKFDGSNKDLEEIYPSIEGVKYSDLRADTDIKDIDGNSGQNAFPNYGGDEVINQLLAIGYKHNGEMFDDANVGSGRLPDPGDTIVGIQNVAYKSQSTQILTEGQDYYYGPETTLFSVNNVSRGKYFIVPVVGKEPYFKYNYPSSAIVDGRVGFIIRVKQTISGTTTTIAEYISDQMEPTGSIVLPTLPDVFYMDKARVPDITVTAPNNTTASIAVTFTPILWLTQSQSGLELTLKYSIEKLDGGSDSTYIWAPASNVDSSNQPFHVFVKDMGFDIVAQFTSDATPKMVMKSGMCNGMEFQIGEAHEVITYDGKKGYMLTLYRADDTNLNTYYPSSGYQLTAGDEFVLTGIDLPDVYIEAAENRLLRAATIWLAENGDTRFKYQPSIDEIYLRRNYDNMVSAGTPEKSVFWRLYAGWKLKFTDIPSTNPDLEVMIESVSITMGDKITRKVDITLNDEPTQSTLKKTESNVKDLSTNVKALGSGMATLVTMDTLREYTDKNFVSKVKDDSKLGKLDIETDLNAGNDIKADRDVIGMRGVIAKGIGSMSMGGGGGNGTLTEIRINGTRIPDTSGVVNLPLAVGGNNGNDGAMSSADKDKLDGIAEHANNYVLPIASVGTLGGVRVGAGLSINASGVLSATYSLPLAANGTRGGVQIGYQSNGRNYAVELDGEKMFVNVPWTDTTYESKAASQGGTAVSLVTTGEKYTWNAKQDAIADLSTIRTQAGEGHTAYGYFSGGILPISAGGTGASTASAARTALGLGAAATYGVGSVAASNTGLVTGGDVYSAINSALTAAMKIEGETTTQISDGSTANPVVIGGQSVSAYKGMVVFYGSKEFVWVGTSWKELGDESSFAIKTTTITGTGYLSGGGDLSASRTIDIAQTIKDKIDTSYNNNHTHSNKSVLDGISATDVSHWGTAYTNNHTHSNKSILDGIAGTAGTTYNLDTITSNISTLQGYFSNGSANTAVKLLNARTIWGQSFDGSANVSGAMSGVTNIDSLLYFDTTNVRLGVGVSNPSDKFHVGGNVIANGGVAAKGIASMSMGGTGGGGTLTQIKINNVALADVDGVVNIPLVTTSADGAMSSSDKSKLDGIAEHANNYTLPAATSGALGGIRLGYSASGKNYPVQLDGSNKAYVNVPWENTEYTFYNLAFQNASGTQVDIYKPTTSPTKTIKAGSNVTISATSNVITIAATDTTYESKAAASGGTDVSLVTTGEKYNWNNKISENQTITLSGDVSGSGKTSISVSIGAGKVTNAMLAGSIANSKLVNSSIKLAGRTINLGDTVTQANLRSDLGLGDLAYINKGSGSAKFLREDGTWQSPSDANTAQLQVSDTANRKINTIESTGKYIQFTGGTNKFTVTDGTNSFDVAITPSISNNITGSGTSGYIAKFNGTNTITNGPAFGSDTTKFLRNDGTWVVPAGTYSLPTASADTKGGIKVGTGLTINSAVLSVSYGNSAGTACQGNDSRLSDARTPVSHASSGTGYGVGTTSNYGHVKTQTGDMNGTSSTNGIAAGLGHTHSQYAVAANLGTASTHAHGDYVTAIGTSGNTLTWSKGGTAQTAITVPYATAAGKLNTNAGSATNPVYFANGVPVACTYSLNKTVPADAVFTDTTYSANNGVGLSGTTFYNSGVRAATINGNYLRINTNGTNADLTIPYATSATTIKRLFTKLSEAETAEGYYKIATITHSNCACCSFTMLVSNSYAGTKFNTLFDFRCSDNSTTLNNYAFNIIGGTDISSKLAYLETKSGNNVTKLELFMLCTRYEHPEFFLIAQQASSIMVLTTSDWGVTPDKASSTTMTGNAANTIVASALTSTSIGSSTQPVYFNANGKPIACTNSLNKTVPSDALFTDANVKQEAVSFSSYTNWRTIPFGASNSATETFDATTVTGQLYSVNSLKFQPSSGTLRTLVFKSIASQGTAPLVVASTTRVANLNADLLDGYEASALVKYDGGAAEQTIKSSIGSLSKGVINLWRNSGDHYTFLGFSNGTTETYLGGIGFKAQNDHNLYRKDGGNYYKIWDENNDGSGSGLDADKLDGQQGSYYATASSVTTLQGYFTDGVANVAAKLGTTTSLSTNGSNSGKYMKVGTAEMTSRYGSKTAVIQYSSSLATNDNSGTYGIIFIWMYQQNALGNSAAITISQIGDTSRITFYAVETVSSTKNTVDFYIKEATTYNGVALTTISGNIVFSASGTWLDELPTGTRTIQPSFTARVGSADKLTTSRSLWGQSFNGTANVSGNMSSVGNISFSASGKNIGGLLYFDTTNARVGLGLSNPSDKFHIDGNVIANGGIAAKGIASMSMNGGGGAAGAVTQINVGSTPYTPTDGIVTLPSSYPASDVSAWAKASTRPAYTTNLVATSSAASLTLAFGSKYNLSAGDTSFIFGMPSLPSATTGQAGIAQLSSAVNSTSETLAATAKAVKTAYDLADGKANAKLNFSTSTASSLTMQAAVQSTYVLWYTSSTTSVTLAQASGTIGNAYGDIVHYILFRNNGTSSLTITMSKYNNSNYYLVAPAKSFVVPANSSVEISYVHLVNGAARYTVVTIGDIMSDIS